MTRADLVTEAWRLALVLLGFGALCAAIWILEPVDRAIFGESHEGKNSTRKVWRNSKIGFLFEDKFSNREPQLRPS
jgi:cyanate permease